MFASSIPSSSLPNPKTASPDPKTNLPNPKIDLLLRQCSTLSDLKQLHAHLIKTGLSQNHLFRSRVLQSQFSDYALLVFSNSPNPTPLMRNSIMKRFAESKTPQNALSFYSDTHEIGLAVNDYTFPVILKACSRVLGVEEGRQIHSHVIKFGYGSEIHVCNTLIHLYAYCGYLDCAFQVFDKMLERETVSWNAMISGYLQNGDSGEALNCFREMQLDGVEPNEVTMIGVLTACAHAGALELGKWAHAYIERQKLDGRINVKTALVDMYSKCGSVERALEVFEKMPKRNIVCWTAMINGLAVNGYGMKAVEFFYRMVGSNIQPDAVSLISVLSACSHGGLLEEGRKLFANLRKCYGVAPQMEHYGCMVDLLGRSGILQEAYELIKNMPFRPNTVMWRTLLGACTLHKNVRLGEKVVAEILKLEPRHHSDYVLLSNIYAAEGRWEDAANVRRAMKRKGINKIPGCSMIEVENRIHSFIVEDKSHQHSKEIHQMLEQMGTKLKLAGYAPNTSKVLIDMNEEEKENALGHHSEKVAVAFGLIKTTPGTPLRIVKNLRICEDCHLALKLVSKVYARDVTVRDRNRFHHFKEGSCSCGDYW